MSTSNAAQLAAKGLQVTPFHKDVFRIISGADVAIAKLQGTMQSRLGAVIATKYGAVAPTFAQFKLDRAALKELAVKQGRVDDQWLRKPFNAAIIALFGALPEAQTKAAIDKRAARDAAGVSKGKAGKGKSGAAKGETAPRRTSEPETIEQYIARVGVLKVLDACTAILASHESTAAQAAELAKVAHPKAA